MKCRFKMYGIIFMILLILLVSGCGDKKSGNNETPTSPIETETINPETKATVEDEVDEKEFSAAVDLMNNGDYEEAAVMLDGMGSYRNADYLSKICHGFISEDFISAANAALYVDAAKTFPNVGEGGYDSYELAWDIYCRGIDEENREPEYELNKLCESVYCMSMLYYDDIQLVDGEVKSTYDKDKDSMLVFGKGPWKSEYFDDSLLSECNGKGTCKVLIIEKDKYKKDQFSMLLSNMCHSIQPDKIAKNLSEVEYVIFINSNSEMVGVYSNGAAAMKYKAQILVRQYPSGDVVYDSGMLVGEDPADEVTVSGPTASIGGKMPDFSKVIEELSTLLDLKFTE